MLVANRAPEPAASISGRRALSCGTSGDLAKEALVLLAHVATTELDGHLIFDPAAHELEAEVRRPLRTFSARQPSRPKSARIVSLSQTLLVTYAWCGHASGSGSVLASASSGFQLCQTSLLLEVGAHRSRTRPKTHEKGSRRRGAAPPGDHGAVIDIRCAGRRCRAGSLRCREACRAVGRGWPSTTVRVLEEQITIRQREHEPRKQLARPAGGRLRAGNGRKTWAPPSEKFAARQSANFSKETRISDSSARASAWTR